MIKSITWRRTFYSSGGFGPVLPPRIPLQHRQLSLLVSMAYTDRGIRTPTSEDLAI